MFNKTDKIFIAGHKGLLGSALVERLLADGYKNILTADRASLNLPVLNALQFRS
jgi:GDP-L-fucose synthase